MCKYVYDVSSSVNYVNVSNTLSNFPPARDWRFQPDWWQNGSEWIGELGGEVAVALPDNADQFRAPTQHDLDVLFKLAAHTFVGEDSLAPEVGWQAGRQAIDRVKQGVAAGDYELIQEFSEREWGAQANADRQDGVKRDRTLAGKVTLRWRSLDAAIASLGFGKQNSRTQKRLIDRLVYLNDASLIFHRSGWRVGPLVEEVDHAEDGTLSLRLSKDVVAGLFYPLDGHDGYKHVEFPMPTQGAAAFNVACLLPVANTERTVATKPYGLSKLCDRIGLTGPAYQQRCRLKRAAERAGAKAEWHTDKTELVKLVVPPAQAPAVEADSSPEDTPDQTCSAEPAETDTDTASDEPLPEPTPANDQRKPWYAPLGLTQHPLEEIGQKRPGTLSLRISQIESRLAHSGAETPAEDTADMYHTLDRLKEAVERAA